MDIPPYKSNCHIPGASYGGYRERSVGRPCPGKMGMELSKDPGTLLVDLNGSELSMGIKARCYPSLLLYTQAPHALVAILHASFSNAIANMALHPPGLAGRGTRAIEGCFCPFYDDSLLQVPYPSHDCLLSY